MVVDDARFDNEWKNISQEVRSRGRISEDYEMLINISTSKSTSILGLNADVSWHEDERQGSHFYSEDMKQTFKVMPQKNVLQESG